MAKEQGTKSQSRTLYRLTFDMCRATSTVKLWMALKEFARLSMMVILSAFGHCMTIRPSNASLYSVVLIDLSMPVLDGKFDSGVPRSLPHFTLGVGATHKIRDIEAERKNEGQSARCTRVLALTGMSSLEDKRRAFEAGVDG